MVFATRRRQPTNGWCTLLSRREPSASIRGFGFEDRGVRSPFGSLRRKWPFCAARRGIGLGALLWLNLGCGRPDLEECGALICQTGTFCSATKDGCGRGLCGNGIIDSYQDYYDFYESHAFFHAEASYRHYYNQTLEYLYADYEACDDGNVQDGDGCSAECKSEECGNGIVNGKEECDAGRSNVPPQDAYDSQACTTLCRKAARCGDGIVDRAFGEQCDGSAACDGRCHTVLTQNAQ